MGESPAQAGPPVSPASAGGDNPLGLRIAAALVDLTVLFVVSVVVGVTIGDASVEGEEFSFLLSGAALNVFLVLVLLYYFALEAVIGRTVGKLLLGLQVVDRGGGRPSVWAVAIRTVLRVVDWLPWLYLVGFIATIATGTRRQRLGDLAAKTSVARALPIRHRGLAAALLGSCLFLAFAVSVASVGVPGDFTSTSASSTCIIDRCNATARGDQVMDLFDHDVGVTEIGAASATFTIDGDTVTLRVGESRQVGPSLVHLASVEDDVAKFSVDFSGLFVNRSDLENMSVDEATYESYTQVADDQGVITIEVPVEWNDLDGGDNPEYGPSIQVAPDLEQFRDTWDVPGIVVEVSSRFGRDDIDAMMKQGPSDQCNSEGREAYQNSQYTGEIERWTGCDGTDTTKVVAAFAPEDGSVLVRVFGQAVDDRDLDAIDRAIDTFEISKIDAAESEATVTDDVWLETITTLRAEIDVAIAKTGSELTPPVLTEMARAMRTCSEELASTGPPSNRLREVHALVKKACQKYDNGADCLSTAAELGNPEVGSAEDRRHTEALDCGFDDLNRGSELLVDAEIEAENLPPPPG